jgi:hypothetical protein
MSGHEKDMLSAIWKAMMESKPEKSSLAMEIPVEAFNHTFTQRHLPIECG